MITIRSHYEKFKVTFSNPGSGQRGFSVLVKNLDEVHTILDHYHFCQHDKANCPLCQKEK